MSAITEDTVNYELFKQVQEHIQQQDPQKFIMEDFCQITECGTVACIGGWGLLLTERYKPEDFDKNRPHQVWDDAKSVFGLTEEQADSVFLQENWPDEFLEASYDADVSKLRDIAVERIERFIQSKGAE